MDDDNQFDSVQWQREASSPERTPQSHFPSDLPSRSRSRQRDASTDERQAGDNADAVDLAGIGEGVLECTVDAPQKENDGTPNAYVSYLISTHSDFKAFQKSDFSVRRRFTDFVFLRQTLHREYPACAVPPLPDKNAMAYVRGDRFSTEFTQRRAWSLHRFIKRLSMHPVLRRAVILLLFLETTDWNAQMKTRPQRSTTMESASGAPTGFFDNMGDTILNAFSKVHKPDKRFMEVTERANKLDEDLNHVEKIVNRVARREGDLETDYADLAASMRKLTPLEPQLEPPLDSFSSSIEETSRGWKALKDHTDQNYLGSLKDMEAYILSVKALLKTREQKQLDFEGLTDYLQRATAERDILASHSSTSYNSSASVLNPATFIRNKMEDMRGVDHETARRDRARKLDLRIEELNREVESAKSTSEMFDEQVVREVSDFERIKGLEFRDSLGALAEQHIGFYSGVVDTWEGFLREMEKDGGVGREGLVGKDKARAVGL